MGRSCSAVGNRIGADEALSRALGPAKESNYALESPKGGIQCRAVKAKTEIPVKRGSFCAYPVKSWHFSNTRIRSFLRVWSQRRHGTFGATDSEPESADYALGALRFH